MFFFVNTIYLSITCKYLSYIFENSFVLSDKMYVLSIKDLLWLIVSWIFVTHEIVFWTEWTFTVKILQRLQIYNFLYITMFILLISVMCWLLVAGICIGITDWYTTIREREPKYHSMSKSPASLVNFRRVRLVPMLQRSYLNELVQLNKLVQLI